MPRVQGGETPRRGWGGDSRHLCRSSFIDVAFVDGDGDDVRVRRDVESL